MKPHGYLDEGNGEAKGGESRKNQASAKGGKERKEKSEADVGKVERGEMRSVGTARGNGERKRREKRGKQE